MGWDGEFNVHSIYMGITCIEAAGSTRQIIISLAYFQFSKNFQRCTLNCAYGEGRTICCSVFFLCACMSVLCVLKLLKCHSTFFLLFHVMKRIYTLRYRLHVIKIIAILLLEHTNQKVTISIRFVSFSYICRVCVLYNMHVCVSVVQHIW